MLPITPLPQSLKIAEIKLTIIITKITPNKIAPYTLAATNQQVLNLEGVYQAPPSGEAAQTARVQDAI
jgi:hypothetical protein